MGNENSKGKKKSNSNSSSQSSSSAPTSPTSPSDGSNSNNNNNNNNGAAEGNGDAANTMNLEEVAKQQQTKIETEEEAAADAKERLNRLDTLFRDNKALGGSGGASAKLLAPITKNLIGKSKYLSELLYDARPPHYALVGRRGAGKSALVNALCKRYVRSIGDVQPMTGAASVRFFFVFFFFENREEKIGYFFFFCLNHFFFGIVSRLLSLSLSLVRKSVGIHSKR